MEVDIFYKWFKIFEGKTTTCKDRTDELKPCLVIYDGHLSHVWFGTLELAHEQNSKIIKVPAYTTALLQPLDAAVFKSLKSSLEHILFDRLKFIFSDNKYKAKFLLLIASKDVWNKELSIENIISGFLKSGIFPANRTVYPKSRFSHQILKKYKE